MEVDWDMENEEIREQPEVEISKRTGKPKKKPRGRNGQFPPSRAGLIKTDEDRMLVSRFLNEVMTEYRQTKVKSDEELAQRLGDYFERCAARDQIPTVEEMIMSTGYSYDYMHDIQVGRRKGFSPETAQILKKAKDYLRVFDAKLVVSGKMNPIPYIFRAKNYYGMSDKTEYVITPNAPQEETLSAEEIAKRYLIDDSVESSFVDNKDSDSGES